MRRRSVSVFSGVFGAALFSGAAGAATAGAGEAGPKQLRAELNALRAKVEQLEKALARQSQPLDARGTTGRGTADREVDATVARVLSDAERRSQLLQMSGFTAGYDKGKFVVRSENGDFSLSPGFQLQLRYVANHRSENADNEIDGDATTEHGFEIRRLKMNFTGNVFGQDTTYKFQWATNRTGGNVFLEDAYVTHRFAFDRDFAVRAGQFKDPTFHEEITSFGKQLAADRSLANEVLAGGQTDRVQGVGLIWDDGDEGLPVRAEVGFTDGPNSDNTNFVDAGGSAAFDAASPDFGVYGRAEYLLAGDLKDYEDFTARGNVQDLLIIGAGGFYTQAGDNNVLMHTFDAQYEYNRLGMFAAYYGVYSNSNAGESSYDLGGVGQAGYMLTDRWEAFGRYSLVSLDSGTAGGDENYHEFTAGANYYLHRHAAKFTIDVTYLPDGVPSDQDQLGELDPDADDEQFVLRGQFQLLL